MADQDNPALDSGEPLAKPVEDLSRFRVAGTDAARDLAGFIDRAPTPYHAVREVRERLLRAGFTELFEHDVWSVAPGGRHFVVRGGSTIVAFIAGSEPLPRAGMVAIGAHTDSPNLRIKPNADVINRGYQQLGVEVYGGALFSTWLDRDLSIAGRVFVRSDNGIESHLVDLERPVARIPNLAIHLNRGVNTDGLVINPQRHLVPIVGLGKGPALRAAVARALGVREAAIASFDLSLYDTTRATVGGLEDELVFASRLDNLASCHAIVRALVAQTTDSPRTRLAVLYDHEECGSKSSVGAGGSILRDTIGRLIEAHGDGGPQSLGRAMAQSILVSADMAHAVHPNYADQHDPMHAPVLNQGLVIKSNANQSYATNAASSAWFESCCRLAGFSPQFFVVRSDLPCGSTIGPITAAELGISTVDVGAPMLGMHSCRETAGTLDVHLATAAFQIALSR